MNKESQVIQEEVKDYYGKVLSNTEDLKTTACCTEESIPDYLKPILSQIHPEIMQKFYGCGSPLPLELEGATVLDLGCGTGRDVYLASALVGENGKSIGVDMTDEQISIAEKHQDYHQEKFGHSKNNVQFVKGLIEDLSVIPNNSVDVVISNCVINLSSNKTKVLEEVFRILKPGGELYFSDVFSDRRIAKHLIEDPVLYGECLSGAMYIEDFRRTLQTLGCPDYRVMTTRIMDIKNKEIEEKLGNIVFSSITIRAFKLKELEDQCEDYGQIVVYQGTMDQAIHQFVLDNGHTFETGKPTAVCSNTAFMLSHTRFKKHFKIIGDLSQHFGLFDCSSSLQTMGKIANEGGSCC